MVSKNEELTITEQCALLEINRQTLYYKPADKTEKLNEDEYIMKKNRLLALQVLCIRISKDFAKIAA